MNKYIKLAACAFAMFGLAACSEEEVKNVDVNSVPEVSDYADCFAVTVDQETNYATFTFTGTGAYPVWIIDGKTYSSNPTYTKYYRKAGTYSVEAKVGNANGISLGSIELPFTIDNTKMSGFGGYVYDTDYNLWKSATKQLNSFYYAPGWSQIDDPVYTLTEDGITLTLPSATTDQWQAQAHIGTDLCLQAGEHYDGSFIITTTQDLSTAVFKLHPQGDDDDNHSFFPNSKIKTTAGEPVCFWFSDVEANVDMNNCVLTLDFGGNPDNVEITIENIVIKNHKNDDGTVLPDLPTTVEPTWVDVTSADNLWSSYVPSLTFYYAPGWSQLADPTPTIDGQSVTISLPSATSDQWQAQMAFVGGPAFGTDALDVKVEFETNVDLPGVTFKLTQEDDDNNYFFTERVAISAGVYSFWVSDVTPTVGAMSSSKFVFDFGGNPADTEVTVKSIIVQKHLD